MVDDDDGDRVVDMIDDDEVVGLEVAKDDDGVEDTLD